MADQKSRRKRGTPKRAGKRAGKISSYYSSKRLMEKKLRRIIRSSGFAEASRWADQGVDCSIAFQKLMKKPPRWVERKKQEAFSKAESA